MFRVSGHKILSLLKAYQQLHVMLMTFHRGTLADDTEDTGYAINNARRRSNSSTQALNDFKTKFEHIDQEPVFEEELHGPSYDDIEEASNLSREESGESFTESVDDEDGAHTKKW